MTVKKQKTYKVLDICVEGVWLECIFHTDCKRNPYKLYRRWFDGGAHRKKLEEYGNFVSVVEHIRGMCFSENWGFKDTF